MKTIIAILLIGLVIGGFFLTRSCFPEAPPKRGVDRDQDGEQPSAELIAWVEFLYGTKVENEPAEKPAREDIRRTVDFLLKAAGNFVPGEDIGPIDAMVSKLLKEHPAPDEFAFIPNDTLGNEFRRMEMRFSTNQKFQDFLENVNQQFESIRDATLRDTPFFPKSFKEIELLDTHVGRAHVDTDTVYLSSDFEKFKNLSMFLAAFRGDATEISWKRYRDHFRLSRKDSPESVITHIVTLPEFDEQMFIFSEGERELAELLKLIRSQYPKSEN